MIHGKDSSNGSGSSDSDRSEGKQKGDACEGNVHIIDNESRNIEISNVVKHVGELLRFNPTYPLCHAFPHHEIGIAGEADNKFTFSVSGVSNLSPKKKRTMTKLCVHLRQ